MGETRNHKKEVMRTIEDYEWMVKFRSFQPKELEDFYGLRRRINGIYHGEDIMWRRRAKCKWLKKGNANMAVFHMLASMRRRGNTIHALESNGELVQKKRELE